MIEVESLSKTFVTHRKEPGLRGSLRSLIHRERVTKEAVRGVTFHIGEGEIVGLIGANGAGKTTLVKMLAGIVHPTSGTARVLGYTPWQRDDRMRQQIALIMGQKAQLWWDLPAADSLLLLREIYSISHRDYDTRLDELCTLLAVEDTLHVPLRRLSLGERMKMELIAALLHAPRVVFLDEPTIGLDLTTQRAIRDFILAYRERHRPAMIITSHYMDDIERLCRRILVLRQGSIVYDGALDQIRGDGPNWKLVTARLRAPPDDASTRTLLEPYGRVDYPEPDVVRVRAPSDAVTRVAATLLERMPVADLSIEGEPLADIIERILAERTS